MDLNGFVAAITNQASTFSGDAGQTPINYCVRRFEPTSDIAPFEDRFIFDFLLYGDCRPEYVWQSLHGDLLYCVDSPAAEMALSSFENGHRAAVFYSDLGNGKSGSLEILKVKAFDAGYDVYSLASDSDSSFGGVKVFRSHRKTVLIIEQYPDWFGTIEFVAKQGPTSCVLAVSARTSTHDVVVDRLAEMLKPGSLVEIPVNTLQPKQCAKIVELFDHYGLWASLAGKSKERKLRHLSEKCHSEWHAILIDRFNAPQIRDRFAPIIEGLAKRKCLYEVVVATLILNVLEYNPSVDLLLGSAVREYWKRSSRMMLLYGR